MAASLKTWAESEDKTLLRSQFGTLILMSDIVVMKETEFAFFRSLCDSNDIFLQRGIFCNKIEQVKHKLLTKKKKKL